MIPTPDQSWRINRQCNRFFFEWYFYAWLPNPDASRMLNWIMGVFLPYVRNVTNYYAQAAQ